MVGSYRQKEPAMPPKKKRDKRKKDNIKAVAHVGDEKVVSKSICNNKICRNRGSKTCPVCHVARYCSKECQRVCWKRHKKVCKAMKAEAEAEASTVEEEQDEEQEQEVRKTTTVVVQEKVVVTDNITAKDNAAPAEDNIAREVERLRYCLNGPAQVYADVITQHHKDSVDACRLPGAFLKVPPNMPPGPEQLKLRDYQVLGVQWLERLTFNGCSGVLADETGLGKTIQVIALIAHLLHHSMEGPFLIVTPSLSISKHWEFEFARWCPTISTCLYHGSNDERHELRQNKLGMAKSKSKSKTKKKIPVIIASHEVLTLDIAQFRRFSWFYLVLDEGRSLNKEAGCCSIRSLLLTLGSQLNFQQRLLLTETPVLVQNKFSELLSLLYFVMPEHPKLYGRALLGFNRSWCWDAISEDEMIEYFVKEARLDIVGKVQCILAPFVMRRLKTDVGEKNFSLLHQDDANYGPCCVCLEECSNDGATASLSDCCGALFHSECIKGVMNSKIPRHLKERCHHCREPLPKSDKEYNDNIVRSLKKGKAWAQNCMGQHYRDGSHGIQQSSMMAVMLFEKAIKQGDSVAMYNLGCLYQTGQGVVKSFKKAFKLYSAAAEKGHASAMYNLAAMHRNGQGTVRSCNKAVALYTMAIERGHVDAMYNLGVMYDVGDEVAKSFKKAFKFYNLAVQTRKDLKKATGHFRCRSGLQALTNLGNMYENGDGVVQSFKKAVELYTTAAKEGHAPAMNNLGFMYVHGRGVARSYELTREWWTKAASLGENEAIERLHGLLGFIRKNENENMEEEMRKGEQVQKERPTTSTTTSPQPSKKEDSNDNSSSSATQPTVLLYGLTTATHLNGQCAKRGVYSTEKKRYLVHFETKDLAPLWIKEKNMRIINNDKMSDTDGKDKKNELHRTELSATECKTKGNECLKAKQYDQAISWYTAAIEKDPSNHIFYSNRSAAQLQNGDVEAALVDGEATIAAKPDWPKGYNRKGCALLALERYDEAIEVFNAGLKIAPDSNLLTQPLKKANDQKSYVPTTIDMACPICLDDFSLDTQTWTRLSCCGKGIHPKCFQQMMRSNHMSREQKEKCPYCTIKHPKDNEEMLQNLRKKVENGKAWAQCTLAQFYRDGRAGVQQSGTMAAMLYEKAIAQDDSNAMYELACMHERGRGVTKSDAKATELYSKAALMGLGRAQLNCGNMYKQGRGVQQSFAMGNKFHQMAAHQGTAAAQLCLGNSYADGLGVAQSNEMARYWWEKAAAQGEESAMKYLADLNKRTTTFSFSFS